MSVASCNPRLSKLLPRLASNHDGEVVATARAIERVLRASGHDWHDLAAAVAPPIAPDESPLNWRTLCRFCAGQHSRLRPRDLDFIVSLSQRRGDPTPKQLKWLQDIAARLRSNQK
jgi:hypothetical protein